MKHHKRIAAGTTLALLMGSTALLAAPLSINPASGPDALILAQGRECPPDNPDCAPGERAAPAQEPEAREPERRREEAPAAEEPPAREEAPAERPAERAPEPPATPPAAEQPAERPAERFAPPEQREAPAEREEPAPRREAPTPQPAEPRGQAPRDEAPAERAPAEPTERPQPETPAPQPGAPGQPSPFEQRPGQPGEGGQQPAPATPLPRGETPAPQPSPGGERPGGEAPRDTTPVQPAPGTPAPQPGAPDQPSPFEQRPGQPGEGGQQPAPVTPLPGGETPQPAPGDGAQPAPGTQPETPVLDSQKEAPPTPGGQPGDGAQRPPADGARPGEGAQPPQPQEAGPPPANDREAQESAAPVEIEPVTAEEGRRIEADAVRQRRERPQGSEVLREIGDRVVIQFNNQTFVESDDRQRLSRGARDVYYEELPRGRTREVIQRENGVQVVTIRDRYGDVVRRSRITPDGREYVLVYADDRDRDRGGDGPREWYDPGRDLPPLRLTIPVEEYILDAERVEDPDSYYEFLEQPPVERVERLYSIDEVRHSARLRDTVRRIDLDTITFEFGSASVPESEISRLEGVANAMSRLLENNPAETFLIEGHTDAVGSDVANLALSDQRAAAVADALSNVFDIPPENLVPQGYGERYLKVNTQEPERENRRVAIRRITPLVAPAQSASNR